MLYSAPAVHTTGLGYTLIAIAEGPGGQLLMLLMGISFTLKPVHTSGAVGKKGVVLLLTGYLLNVLKFVIPYMARVLPAGVLRDLAIRPSDPILLRLR